MTDKAREEFEGWVQERSVDTPAGFYPQLTYRCALDPDRYMTSWVDAAWDGWKASRAAIVVELPSIREITMGRRENEHDSGFNAAVDLCIDAVEAVGLKVKP